MEDTHMHEVILMQSHIPAVLECSNLVCRTPFVHADRTLPFNVLIYVTGGQITVTEDGTEYEINPGELLFLKQGVHHYGRKTIKTGTSWYYVHFTLPKESADGVPLLTVPKKRSGLAGTEIESRLRDFTDLYLSRNDAAQWKAGALLYDLLCDIALYPQHARQPRHELSEKIAVFLNCRISEPFDSRALEREFNLTGKYLELVFKRERNVSLHKYDTGLKNGGSPPSAQDDCVFNKRNKRKAWVSGYAVLQQDVS